MGRKILKVLKIILVVFYTLFLILFGVYTLRSIQLQDTKQDFNIFGSYYYTDPSNGSDLLVVSPSGSYQKGDTVVYKVDDKLKVGRVDSIVIQDEAKVITAISNKEQDHVAFSDAVGQLSLRLPAAGAVFAFLSTIYAPIVAVVVLALLLIIPQIVRFVNFRGVEEEEEDSEELPSAQESPFVLEEEEELDLDPEEPQSPTQQTTGVDRSAKALERFMNESISLDDSLDRLLSEMKYKMEFQDTHQLSNRLETVIDENDNLAQNLTPYGLQTSMIDNGIQIEIDTTKTKALKLLLKNDGSLTLITDSYQAEINSDLS